MFGRGYAQGQLLLSRVAVGRSCVSSWTAAAFSRRPVHSYMSPSATPYLKGSIRTYSQSRYKQFREWQKQVHEEKQRLYDESEPEPYPEYPNNRKILLMRPALWAVAFTAGTFYLCSDIFVDRQEKLLKKARGIFDIIWSGTEAGSDEDRIWALMSDPAVRGLVGSSHAVSGESHARTIRLIARLPGWVPFELKRTAVAFSDSWYQLSRGQRCIYTIVGINTVVFSMWQIPRLLPFMARHFLHDPRSGLSYTMLTSTFSHREVWHFLFNMVALVSFGVPVVETMGLEQFSAFYLSAGVASSLASQLLSPIQRAIILPSLGASGAVYGVVGATMMMFPHTKIALIFLPFFGFTITQAFPALLAYDFAGAVLGWSSFNHVAHLGGALYGMAYPIWGADLWNRLVHTVRERRQNKNHPTR
ncbi:hypothetical protein H4S08_002730 [Coemansia sp. RSA 1365]|nr:hypothetical protein H4S08_002730 [Coemansia sp. RSA 1365]